MRFESLEAELFWNELELPRVPKKGFFSTRFFYHERVRRLFQFLSLSDAALRTSRQHPLCYKRPWLVLVTDHPAFPDRLPDHPLAADYIYHWEMFARGLVLHSPKSFAAFLRSPGRPRTHHWRLAIFGKVLLLLRRLYWKRSAGEV